MPATEERKKQVADFLSAQFPDKSFEKFYPRAEVREFIEKSLVKKCANFRDDAAAAHYLDVDVKQHFDEIKRCRKRLENALRKEREIKKCELLPGKVNISTAAEQMKEFVPTGSVNRGWISPQDGYEKGVGGNFWSFAGGTKAEYEAILDDSMPIEHSSHPGWRYRNNVIDSQRVARSEVRVAEAELVKYLDTGYELTDAEKEKIRRGQDRHQVVQNLAESALAGTLALTSSLGKGLISNSRAEEDPRFKAWEQKRNEMIAKVMWQLGPSVKNAAYLDTVMAEVTNSLSSGSSDEALASQAVFSRVQNLISERQKEEDELAKKRVEAMQKKSDEMGSGMVSGLQKLVDEEDDMHKYRLLQLFLLLTPIGGLSIFGSVLSNWVGPVTDLLGPLFEKGVSFDEGVASMATSDVLGPFGDFAGLLKVDVATKWILENAPIISQFGDFFDFLVKNDMMQEFIGAFAPFVDVDSPVVPLFAACAYSFFRADKEFAHSGKVDKLMKDELKKVEDEFNKFAKETNVAGQELLEKRVAKFAKDKVEVFERANADAKLAAFISGLDDEKLKIFKDVKFKNDGKEKTFSELKAEGKLSSASAVLEFLKSGEALNKSCLDKFLLVKAVGLDGFEEAQKDKDKAAKSIADQLAKLNQDFVIDAAQKSHRHTAQTDRKKMYEDFKAQFVEEEAKRLCAIAEAKRTSPKLPATSPAVPAAVGLGGAKTPQAAAAAA